MKRFLLTTVAVAAACLAIACKYAVPQFWVQATDGTTYKTAGLVGKPTIFVFLSQERSAEAIAGFNKLAANYKGHVQVIGVVHADLTRATRFARENRIRFPLIPDTDGAIANGFEAKNNFDMTIVATKTGEPRFPKVWNGYSKANVEELLSMIEHHGFALPKVK
jgi:peroxiredoxin